MMQQIAIKTRNLNFFYSKAAILDGIHLDIEKQKITALIGPSGSGKSTLLRVFNRLDKLIPSSRIEGEVLINQRNILGRDIDLVALRREIGMVLQKPMPFPMGIYGNLAFALRTHKQLSKADELIYIENKLKAVNLWDEVKDKLYSSASALSGGQQQRLCIARTLCTEPDILLLDEPTSSLDPNSAHHIEELILSMRQEYTIVLVTHNLRQAQRLADTVTFLKQGHLVECLPTAEFFNSKNPITQQYLQYA